MGPLNKYLFLEPPLHVAEHDPHDPVDHFGHSCELHSSVVYGFKLESQRQSDTLNLFKSQRYSLVCFPPPQLAEHSDQPSGTHSAHGAEHDFETDSLLDRLHWLSSTTRYPILHVAVRVIRPAPQVTEHDPQFE